MLVLEWKERTFIEKVNSRCFCWFPAAILVHQNGTPIWRLDTKLYKAAWNVSVNNSETVGHKDLRLGQIVYILVFYNISFSWLLPLDGFKCIFFCRVYCVTVKTKNTGHLISILSESFWAPLFQTNRISRRINNLSENLFSLSIFTLNIKPFLWKYHILPHPFLSSTNFTAQ